MDAYDKSHTTIMRACKKVWESDWQSRLLLFLLVTALLFLCCCGSPLALDATRTSTAIRRRESEINVLLRVKADYERRNIDNLLANTVSFRLFSQNSNRQYELRTGCDAA